MQERTHHAEHLDRHRSGLGMIGLDFEHGVDRPHRRVVLYRQRDLVLLR